MASKKVNIDWTKVDRYLQAQCSGVGIASILGINENTLYRHCKIDNGEAFEAYSAKKKGEGKELLRAKQFTTAMEGNVTMQIWLGKQYLEQKDRTDTTSGDKPIQSNLNVIVDNSETAETLKKLRDELG